MQTQREKRDAPVKEPPARKEPPVKEPPSGREPRRRPPEREEPPIDDPDVPGQPEEEKLIVTSSISSNPAIYVSGVSTVRTTVFAVIVGACVVLLPTPAAEAEDLQGGANEPREGFASSGEGKGFDASEALFDEMFDDEPHERGMPRGALRYPAVTDDSFMEMAAVMRDIVDAVVDNELEGVVKRLSEEDRKRLDAAEGEIVRGDMIEQFMSAWKKRYSQDFAAERTPWQAVPFAVVSEAPAENGDTAPVTVRAGRRGQAQAVLRFVHEGALGATWKLDVRDSLSADTLRDGLRSAFERIRIESLPENPRLAFEEVSVQLIRVLEADQ